MHVLQNDDGGMECLMHVDVLIHVWVMETLPEVCKARMVEAMMMLV